MKARFVLMISVLTIFAFTGIGLSDESPIASDRNDEGIPASNMTEEWTESELSPDGRVAPGGTEVGTNTFYGENAGASTTGGNNTFIGYESGYKNTTGYKNVFVGQDAGHENTTGMWNIFIGSTAGYKNTTAIENVFIGYEAGHENTEGEQNIFIGWRAGYHNETAWGNVFIGSQAGIANETGLRNACVGYHAGAGMTSLSDNTMMGYEAGAHVNANRNTFVGSSAGASSSSSGNRYAHDNTFIGADAGKDITEGDYNTFLGKSSGENITEGSRNSFLGYQAGYNNEDGETNTIIGYWAGYSNTSGNGNIFLGSMAGFGETGSNKLYIDNSITSSPLIWGDFGTNNVVINGGFRAVATSSSSDVRLKRNIEPLTSSLDKISSLQGVSYEWKAEEFPDFGLTEGKQIGLVAQDVENVLPELVSADKEGYKSVSYTRLTAVLVEAVKELKAENQKQKELLEKQQAEIDSLRFMIRDINS